MEKIEALRVDNQALRRRIDKREDEVASLETSVAEVRKTRGLSYVMTCAYKYAWTTPSATITYDYLVSDYKNSDDVNGGDGIMDIASGVYTVIKPAGHYTVTFSGLANMLSGRSVNLYLYHNGTQVKETFWDSYNSGSNEGWIQEQGSRTVTLHLNPMDTL